MSERGVVNLLGCGGCRSCDACWDAAWDALLAHGGGQDDEPPASRYWLIELWDEDEGPYPITCFSVLASSHAEAMQIADPRVAEWEARRGCVVEFTAREER